jgi:hypothetical protein
VTLKNIARGMSILRLERVLHLAVVLGVAMPVHLANAESPAQTGAITMGYWQNKNGQATIPGGSSTGGVRNPATWLRTYAPFQNLSATATCREVAVSCSEMPRPAQATAETPRQPHQVGRVQLVFRPIQGLPPHPHAPAIMPYPEVGVQHHPVDTIVAAFQQIRVVRAQLAHRDPPPLKLHLPTRQGARRVYGITCPTAAPQGPLFPSPWSRKKRVLLGCNFLVGRQDFASRD